jgi:O-antigen ligase
MAAFALLQLAPLLGPATLSPSATGRGLLFVLALVALHQAAAAALMVRAARRRLRRLVAWLGAFLAFVGLAQAASGTPLIYGFFAPWEGGQPFGPFVNRNHFAGYMLLVIPIALSDLGDAWRAWRKRVGPSPNLRRRLLAFSTAEGSRLLHSLLPALAATSALLATTSRGAILAFLAALVLAFIGVRARRGTPAWAAGLVFLAVALAWFGLERLETRFANAAADRPGRTVVWGESLQLMKGTRWATGYGLDAYADALSRVPAWTLPDGATPWPSDAAPALASGESVGFRAPGDLPGLAWYREAHNDWVQLLVETGLPGLFIGVWAAFACLRAARFDPWLFAALAGVLMHCFVDFDMQIPAIPALFCVLAAQPRRRRREATAETEADAEDSLVPEVRERPVGVEA